jgi:hypothetical protein
MNKKKVKEYIKKAIDCIITEKNPVNAIDALIEADRELSKSDWVSVEDAPDIVIRTSRAKGKGWNIDKNGFLCSPASHITHWKPIEKLEG